MEFAAPATNKIFTIPTDHPQIMKINQCISSPTMIKCEVPQWSILGLLLFLIHINDLVFMALLLALFMAILLMQSVECTVIISKENEMTSVTVQEIYEM